MILKEWDKLPEKLKNNEVKEYYKILNKKKKSILIIHIFDFILALLLLIILLPLLIIVSFMVKSTSKGPVFYRQERVTQYGRHFKIFKFRTMVIDADKSGVFVTTLNDSRVTKVGKVIRKYKVDEIPQLINILFGEMSFVGTRPEVIKYVNKYTDEMYSTLLLPAGITSTASIQYKDENELLNTKNNTEDLYCSKILPEKMKYNLEDIRLYSLSHNMVVCIKTLLEVLK